jgi:tetratricopeptide (TPR) repeat protein
MSLLLDALNRASKEKAAAAMGAAGLAARSAPLAKPELELETRAPPAAQKDLPAPDWPNLALTPEPEFKPLPLAVEAPSGPPSLPPDLPKPPPPVPAPVPVVPPPEPIKPPTLDLSAPELTLATSNTPTNPVPPPAQARPVPPPPPPARVAQDIQRAKAPAASKRPPTRLLVLGGVAVLLGLGFFSVFSGWWGDPLAWFVPNSRSSLSPSATMPVSEPAAEAPPELTAVVPTPVAAVESTSDQAKPAALKDKISPKSVSRTLPPTKEEIIEPATKVAQAPEGEVAAKKEVASIQRRSVGPSSLELGYEALTQGRLKEASQAYTQALASNPEERDALLGLAYIAHQQDRDDEANAYYKRVLRQDPGNAVAQSGLIALEGRGDRQDSASRARDVVEQNPRSAAAQAMLGHSLVRENRLADAQQAFYQAHLLEPAVASHAFNLAVALDRMRNYASAQRYYALALSLSVQSGGERASLVPHAAVQVRLAQLRSSPATDPLPTLSQ